MTKFANWKDLVMRAKSYNLASSILLGSGHKLLVQNALEASHLSIELAMKATIKKNEGNYRRTHDLTELANMRLPKSQISIAQLAIAAGDAGHLTRSLSYWNMDCRYLLMEEEADMRKAIEAYKGLYEWIRSNFLT